MAIKVSIIIPLYNRTTIVGETINSVKNQVMADYECIIVDDHSTDDSYELVKRLVDQDERFVLKKRRNAKKGASVCRNEGIDLARGEFIMFLDSDDLLSPNCLNNRYTWAQENKGCDLYLFNVAMFDHRTYVSRRLWSSIDKKDSIRAFVFAEGWQTSNSFFRSDFLKNNHYFDGEAQSWQDVEFHIRALLKNPKIMAFTEAEPDVFIRVSGLERISNTNGSYPRIAARFRTYLKIEKHLLENKISYHLEPFQIYFFKYLEVAARLLPKKEFEDLMEMWGSSETSRLGNRNLIVLYLRVQFYLSRFKMYYLGSVLYRIVHHFLPDSLLYARNRPVRLKKEIDLKKILA